MGLILALFVVIIGSIAITIKNGIKDVKSEDTYFKTVGVIAIVGSILVAIFVIIIFVT